MQIFFCGSDIAKELLCPEETLAKNQQTTSSLFYQRRPFGSLIELVVELQCLEAAKKVTYLHAPDLLEPERAHIPHPEREGQDRNSLCSSLHLLWI